MSTTLRLLSGEAIHIFGRIVALADVFDALGAERCYKPAWPDKRIKSLLHKERGRHFDPKLTDIMLDSYDEFVTIRKRFRN